MPRACFTLLFLSVTSIVAAQNPVPEKIVAALDSFTFLRPQEKTYLQTDRNAYIAGETIWFKAYTLLGEKPTVLSRLIYVDLVDPAGRIMEKNMLKLQDGTANGSISIKQELPTGDYFLRCYTLWMLNFPDFITEKKIIIHNYNSTVKDKPRIAANTRIRINFFPEGGNLINGLKSIVAFKAMDENGLPVTVSGDILNAKNLKILSFKSIHEGMGSFELQPDTNDTYRALVQIPGGGQQSIDLPASKTEGVTLSVDNTNTAKAFVKVERSEKSKEKYNNLLVVAQINNRVAYMGKFNIDEGLDAAAINKKNLPPGIMQVAVLTEDGQPLAERMVFVANHTVSSGILRGGLVDLEKRKKNIIILDAPGFTNLQAAIAVTNTAGETMGYAPNILSAFLLSADIKGYINDPAYYFKDKEAVTLQQLDLLMLINAWRRFKLEDIIANNFSTLHYPFETGMSITGKVLQSNGRSVLKAGRINLIIKGEDSTHIISEAKTNEASVFVVDKIEYKKDATIYYQGTNSNKTEAVVAVQIDSAYFDTLHRVRLNAGATTRSENLPPLLERLLADKRKADSSNGKLLAAVVVRARKHSEADSLNAVYATDIFYNSDQTLPLNQNINYYDVWQFLRMKVPGISINNTDTGIAVSFTRYNGLDMFSENTGNNGIQFFLNEVPVDISIIDGLNTADIALVKIFKGVSGIALGATRGAIAFYTSKGMTGRDWRKKGFDFFYKSGYSVSREFYDMDYAKVRSDSISSDIRTTLYWNPAIKIKDGKASFEFYNDDLCKKYKVVIEGLDAEGKLLHAEKEFE